MHAFNQSLVRFITNPNVFPIIKYAGLLCLFVAPFSLLYVDTTLLFPFITGKNFLWRTLILIAFVSWLTLAFVDERYRLNLRNPVWLGLMGVVCAYGLSAVFGIDPFRSFWSNAERMDGWIGLGHLVLYATTLIGMLRTRTMWHWFLHALLVVGTLVGLTGLAQGDEVGRIYGTLGNPIYLGSVALLSIFICAYFASFKEELFGNQYARLSIYGAWALYFLYILFETGTRGALLGLGIGSIVTAVLVLFSVRRDARPLFWWGSVGVAVLFALLSIAFVFRSEIKDIGAVQAIPIVSRIANVSLEDKTTIHRLANWQIGLEGFQDRPVFGWGQENYIHVFSENYKPEILYDAEQWFDRTHNTLLDWLVFGGLVGFLAYVALFMMYTRTVWRTDTVGRDDTELTPLQRSILTGLLAAYIAQNLVAFDSLASGVFMFAVIAFVAWSYKGAHTDLKDFDIKKLVFILPILWIFSFWWIYHSTIVPKGDVRTFIQVISIPNIYNQNKSQIEAADATPEQKAQLLGQVKEQYITGLRENLGPLEDTIARKTIFSQEILEQMLSRQQLYNNDDVPQDLRVSYINMLAGQAEQLIEEKPYLTRMNLFYAQMLSAVGYYTDRGDQRGADYYFAQALESSPKKLQILLLSAQNELRKGNAEAALTFIDKALELAPEYDAARAFSAQVRQSIQAAENTETSQ